MENYIDELDYYFDFFLPPFQGSILGKHHPGFRFASAFAFYATA